MSTTLHAGTARIDITPSAGEHLSGDVSRYRPAQLALDRLFARALVLEAGDKRMCVLSLDLTIVTEEWVAYIRDGITRRTGIGPDAVMVHGTQTHSAPSAGEFMLDPDTPVEIPTELRYIRGTSHAYSLMASDRAIEAAAQAAARLRPVRMATAVGRRNDLGFNRRIITDTGEAAMPFPGHSPTFNATLRHPEHPHDPDISVLALRDDQLNLAAMLLHFTCHPVNVFCDRATFHAVSADWPGAWCAGMSAVFGEGAFPLVINGCCGDSNPWDPFDANAKLDHRRQGAELTRTTVPLVSAMHFKDVDRLDWRVERVPLDYREVSPERRAIVERVLRENPRPVFDGDPPTLRWEWMAAASTAGIAAQKKRSPKFLYEIHVLRIGDTAIVGLPGEPFSITQMRIKMASPAKLTLVAHNVGHYAGYVPPADAYPHGGHEANPDCTYWAKLAPGSAENIEAAAIRILRDLFA